MKKIYELRPQIARLALIKPGRRLCAVLACNVSLSNLVLVIYSKFFEINDWFF